MDVALWVVAGLLAAVFLFAGANKIAQPKERLTAMGMAWAEDFAPRTITVIGVLEVLGALGLVVPPLVGVAPVLVPLAATGLALVMVGAVVTHARRSEPQMIVANAVLLLLAAFVAWGRFGPYAFTS